MGIGGIRYISIRLELESWPCSGQRDQVDTDVPIVTKTCSLLSFFFFPAAGSSGGGVTGGCQAVNFDLLLVSRQGRGS